MAERQTRLEEAFFLLEVDENVIASHNTACCQTCSHADLSAQLEEQPDKRGYVFVSCCRTAAAALDSWPCSCSVTSRARLAGSPASPYPARSGTPRTVTAQSVGAG